MTEIEVNRLWLKSYDQEVSPNLQYNPSLLFEYLDRNVQKTPYRTAVTFNKWNLSYKRLGQLSENLAANLRANGLRQGEKVAVMLPNTPQTIISYWGILKAGGIVVMTNPLYMEKEIEHHFSDSGARFLIYSKKDRGLSGLYLNRPMLLCCNIQAEQQAFPRE